MTDSIGQKIGDEMSNEDQLVYRSANPFGDTRLFQDDSRFAILTACTNSINEVSGV